MFFKKIFQLKKFRILGNPSMSHKILNFIIYLEHKNLTLTRLCILTKYVLFTPGKNLCTVSKQFTLGA